MGKTIEQMQSEAAELKEKRTLIGKKQIDISDLCGIDQGSYSRMERGLLNCEKPLIVVRNLYNIWLKEKERKIKAELNYIKSLAKS